MYDLGARLQEMIDLKLCDIRISKTSTITIHGKGSKVRTVPIMSGTVECLRQYLFRFHPGAFLTEELPLFYTEIKGSRKSISASCVRLFLSQYGENARVRCSEVPENVHPHLWRHSRAMHLYQNGMDLTLISQWLGHANLETTLIYAYADPEHKRKAIAAATPPDSPLGKMLSPERFTVSDTDTLKRLVGLR
jgi:site-specific recombinase XerD